jgi:anti-anti-sigma factor
MHVSVSDENAEREPAAQQVSAFLERRREQVAQRWAGASLFRTVFTVSRDEAVEAGRSVAAALAAVAAAGRLDDIRAPGFAAVREQLGRMAASHARMGIGADGLADEVAGLRAPVTDLLRAEFPDPYAPEAQECVLALTVLMGTLRLVVLETTVSAGEEVIARQREQLNEVATPVIKLWESTVAVPLIGTLDSARHPRHHRRAHGRLAGRPAPDEDGGRGPADGRRVHRLRHPAGDRADHRPPGHRPRHGAHPLEPGGRAGLRAQPAGRRDRSGPGGRRGRAMTGPSGNGPAGIGPPIAGPPVAGPLGGHGFTVPVLRLGDILLVTLQGELHDGMAEQLQQDITERISHTRVTGVVIDISGVDIVDSFLGRVLAEIAAGAGLLAARTVLAGMRPAVAITLVELGLTLPGLRTALDVERAMEMLTAGEHQDGGSP